MFLPYLLRNWSFEQVNLEGARKIAKISKECGVEKLIHFSALNASPKPQSIYMKNGSKFLRTKVIFEKLYLTKIIDFLKNLSMKAKLL